jgi:hypothetical protein
MKQPDPTLHATHRPAKPKKAKCSVENQFEVTHTEELGHNTTINQQYSSDVNTDQQLGSALITTSATILRPTDRELLDVEDENCEALCYRTSSSEESLDMRREVQPSTSQTRKEAMTVTSMFSMRKPVDTSVIDSGALASTPIDLRQVEQEASSTHTSPTTFFDYGLHSQKHEDVFLNDVRNVFTEPQPLEFRNLVKVRC